MPLAGPLYERRLMPAVEAALEDTPVALVAGSRQAGKTTLCRSLAERRKARRDAGLHGDAAPDPPRP
jgi:predicted AAA+ superfamily ATPase